MLAQSIRTALICALVGWAPWNGFGQQLEQVVLQALEYSNLPPNQRNRDLAVEKILTILPQIQDVPTLQGLTLRVARLYGQSFDHDKEKPDHRAAREFYEKTLALNGVYSLELISARMELADLLSLGKDHAKLFELYKEVISVDPQKIVDAEISPEQLKRIAELQPREKAGGMKENSPEHRVIVQNRLQQAAHGILGRYRTYRRVSIENFLHQVQTDQGLEGLKKLAGEYEKDEEFMKILNRKIAAASVQQWDERLH